MAAVRAAQGDRPRWNGYGRAKEPVSEPSFRPVPRVAPFPISSGVSVRRLPEAKLVDIVRCCQHYESKCAGKYDKGSIGARLLFDLSRDIQDLSQSLVQRDDDRDDRVRHLEVRLAVGGPAPSSPCCPVADAAPVRPGCPGSGPRQAADLARRFPCSPGNRSA
ncbi:hypothetical protein FNF31_03172 [Cafeteria roenbergensis]|uniref:Uncharacterized protein n=1 Tax=Cafeteria roenbergensis TaxID=33653 RepID=A0A5A8DDF6_CAFRO|nr:hypothetical protein FNF31_03172 [Cafeteria roenbergensis]